MSERGLIICTSPEYLLDCVDSVTQTGESNNKNNSNVITCIRLPVGIERLSQGLTSTHAYNNYIGRGH